jgi:transposase, IS5 family
MKQMAFADAEYAGKRKQARKELFLIDMDQVVSWKGLIALLEPHYPKGEGGRPAYLLLAILRIYLMQNGFGYSDPAMEEALYETTILRQFAGVSLERIPDETTILNFRRLLEKHELAAGILAVINGCLGDRGLSLRQGWSKVVRYFWPTSASTDFESGQSTEIDQLARSFLCFWPSQASYGGHFPHYRRTFPAVISKCRRAIHKFDRANSVTSCAVFFTSPRKRTAAAKTECNT